MNKFSLDGIEAFKGKGLYVDTKYRFMFPRILKNGKPLPKEDEDYIYVNAEGKQYKIKTSYLTLFPEALPKLEINGKTIILEKPLHWYEYVWAIWPVLGVIYLEELLVLLITLPTSYLNLKIFRTKISRWNKYIYTGCINAIAIVLMYGITTLLKP